MSPESHPTLSLFSFSNFHFTPHVSLQPNLLKQTPSLSWKYTHPWATPRELLESYRGDTTTHPMGYTKEAARVPWLSTCLTHFCFPRFTCKHHFSRLGYCEVKRQLESWRMWQYSCVFTTPPEVQITAILKPLLNILENRTVYWWFYLSCSIMNTHGVISKWLQSSVA